MARGSLGAGAITRKDGRMMRRPMNERPARILGPWSGVGLVAANMIGAGVFLSTGFMAQDMGPGTILLAWSVGALLALAGALAYATVARLVPRSGGEYRYLSTLLHPALGYLAGWASLLLGFSAPVAVDALAAGAFARTLVPGLDARAFGGLLVVVLSTLHAAGLRLSKQTQDLLVLIKAVLLLGFVAVGLAFGSHAWPRWSAPDAGPGFPVAAFATSLFFIAFAFSGWNAAAYAAEEFRDPERDVPRAMLLGCALVAALYLLVNWVFVANLTPERARAVFEYEASRVTLGHLVMEGIVGATGARVMSGFVIVALVSSMSAMTFAGPRVYAAMAGDGYLPRPLAGRAGAPPAWSIALQGTLALVILYVHEVAEAMQNVGAILTLFAGLTAASLVRVRLRVPGRPAPPRLAILAGALYALSAAWMLYFGFRGKSGLLAWLAAVGLAALVAWGATRRRAVRGAPGPRSVP
jgi:APA family basic amino acid/polyamine antiporter